MYEIVLKTWYQEAPYTKFKEVYHGLGFSSIEDACKYLAENYETILGEFPVESLKIKFNKTRK